MAESIQALRKICQPPQEPTITARAIRYVSIYITWLLVKTPITANQVTFFFLILGIAGSVLLGSGKLGISIFGIILLQLSILFDYSDGEVARYHGTTSMLGSFLDVSFHSIVHSAAFAGIAYAVYAYYWQSPIVFWFGAAAITFALMNRGLPANVMRIFIEGGQSNVVEKYSNIAVSTRKQGQLISETVDLLFGYISFVFIILPIGALFRRLDVVLFYYSTIFPLYYFAKATLLWKRLTIN